MDKQEIIVAKNESIVKRNNATVYETREEAEANIDDPDNIPLETKTVDTYGTWDYVLFKNDGEWYLSCYNGNINGDDIKVEEIIPDLKSFYQNGSSAEDRDKIIAILEEWLSER